jgi:altronate dehydratase small subunit
MRIDAIMIKAADNVATALRGLQLEEEAVINAGEVENKIRLVDNIPFGHKFAVRPIKMGESIIKYGEIIGRATQRIEAGGHAHIQNIESLRGRGDLG